MNRKSWNDLKSVRDLKHRTARLAHMRTLHRRPKKVSLSEPVKLAPVVDMDVKPEKAVTKEKPNVISRIARLFTRRRG